MDDSPSSPLLMFVAHRAAESQVLDAVRAAGFEDVTLAQCRIAQRLSHDGIRLTDLAEQAQVTKQTAGALVDELERISLPFSDEATPSDAELRIAQAQLVGWLEGLFHGIQTALFAQQMAARAQLEQMRRALPAGGPHPGEPQPQPGSGGMYL